jgi:predicted secreted protein
MRSHLHSRRSIVVTLASAAASSSPVLAKIEGSPEDERFMRMAHQAGQLGIAARVRCYAKMQAKRA